MMKTLEAYGRQVPTDDVIEPESDNPDGYYEFERAKQTERDRSWRNLGGAAWHYVAYDGDDHRASV
ncbi:MAG: hypothetical protein PVJ64_07835 [Gemmatimonadales bacterium]|jgi:hypothetical protein